jgi:hypothetical protein
MTWRTLPSGLHEACALKHRSLTVAVPRPVQSRNGAATVRERCFRLFLLLLSAHILFAQSPDPAIPQDPDKARLEGRVFNSVTGEPLRKTHLTLRMNVAQQQGQGRQQQQQPVSTYTVTSDAEGQYVFPNVDPGDYQLTATHDGFADLRLGNRAARNTEPILLGPKDAKTDFHLKLVPYGAIAGVLVDEDGDPIRNLPVSAMKWQYTSGGRELREVCKATSNDHGEYRIFDLPAGKYYVKINPDRLGLRSQDPGSSVAPVFYPGVLEAARATPQELAPGQDLHGVNFNLRRVRFATIHGQVIAPGGSSPNAGLLIASDGGTSSVGGGTDGADGKFTFAGVPPGPIYVTGGYTIAGQRYDTMVEVDVGSSDINGLELRPVPPMDLTGSIRIAGQTTIKPSQIALNLRGPSAGHNQTDSASIRDDGSLLFHLISAGKYHLDIGRLQNLYIKSVQWGTQDITDLPLDLLSGVPARSELAIVLGADAGQIEGIVTSEKSEPAEDATITLVPTGTHRSRAFHKSTNADSAGHFTIRGIAPGEYKLYAWDKVDTNAVIYDPDFLRPYEALGQAIDVAASDKKVIELKVIATKEQ